MGSPEIGTEASRAVAYTGIGALGLKFLQVFLRSFSKRREEKLSEMDRFLASQAGYREELRKDAEARRVREIELRAREDALEKRVDVLEAELRVSLANLDQCQRKNVSLNEENTDLRAEIRAWKHGLRSPSPPSRGDDE